MKILVLAAGYATRLYPLTKTKAKPLLEVAGRPMIEHVLATTEDITGVDEIFVVTNEKFAGDFETWGRAYAGKRKNCPKITVVNDHSTDDSNKLGAIGDLKLVIDSQRVNTDLLVLGGDNLFRASLKPLADFAGKHGTTLGVYDVGDLNEMTKYGAVTVDAGQRITEFVEKPANPHTTLAAMCLYYYPASVLPRINDYVREGNNPDQPGRLIQWLYPRQSVFAYQITGQWLDIGSFETLEQANREFA